jgi:hypothetical protein
MRQEHGKGHSHAASCAGLGWFHPLLPSIQVIKQDAMNNSAGISKWTLNSV